MMSAKESEHFMPREEFKLRKWKRIKCHYAALAIEAERYKKELEDMDYPERTIFFQNCISTFKMISEKAEKKIEKWTKRAKETNG